MRTVRSIGGFVALLVVLTGALTPDALPLFAASLSQLTLNLRMTATQPLPAATRAALMDEAESIWEDGHIRLRWVSGDAEAQAHGQLDATLRVLLMAKVVPAPGDESPWTIGELVRSEGARPLAIASLTGARRVVEATSRYQLLDLPATHDRRLGVVLGRALAHEIGHYLLGTNTHATEGLMRARIDVTEFADLRSGTFRLDKAAQAHLAALAASGTLSPDRESTAFWYTSK